MKYEPYLWGLVGLLTVAAGLAHVAPAQLAGLTGIVLIAPITVQMLAGVSAILAGLMLLGKTMKK